MVLGRKLFYELFDETPLKRWNSILRSKKINTAKVKEFQPQEYMEYFED